VEKDDKELKRRVTVESRSMKRVYPDEEKQSANVIEPFGGRLWVGKIKKYMVFVGEDSYPKKKGCLIWVG